MGCSSLKRCANVPGRDSHDLLKRIVPPLRGDDDPDPTITSNFFCETSFFNPLTLGCASSARETKGGSPRRTAAPQRPTTALGNHLEERIRVGETRVK
jgi:hypothetical protein